MLCSRQPQCLVRWAALSLALSCAHSVGAQARANEVFTCDGVTIRGGSPKILAAISAFGATAEKEIVAGKRDSRNDMKVFKRLLETLMAVAEGEGDDSDGNPKIHVVTAQIGANDGKQNDPFHKFMIMGEGITHGMLKHWVPLMFEPAPHMFSKLTQHWSILAKAKSSACYIAARRPVMYPYETQCPFYYFNSSHIDGDAKICPNCVRCEDHARFMREQLGSLDRDAMKKFFGPNFDRCIASEPLPCGPLKTMLDKLEWAPDSKPHQRADILHIDAEGFDGNIIHGILDSANEIAPPVIFFEAKVMRSRIRLSQLPYSCHFMDLMDRLDADGRVIVYDNGEDAVAIKADGHPTRPWAERDPDRCRSTMMTKYPESWGTRKDRHHPTVEHKTKIWNALVKCCDNAYKVPFTYNSK